MDIRRVGPEFAVAPQFNPEDMASVSSQGFAAVICNRPDGEEEGQPSVAEMREAAQAAGLAFHQLPVAGGAFPDAATDAFRAVRLGSEGPVLAYCRTGTRSIALETLANPESLEPSERLMQAAAAGYDLTAMSQNLT